MSVFRFSPEQLPDLAAQIYIRRPLVSNVSNAQTGVPCYLRAYQAGR